MDQRDVLRLAERHPTSEFQDGEIVVAEGSERTSLFVLSSGALSVRVGGSEIARVAEPGGVVGEIGLLLEAPATADVVAVGPTIVHRIDDAASLFAQHPELGLHLAVVLARRLRRVTTFLGDMQQQYGDRTDALGLLPEVVSSLLSEQAGEIDGGSERESDSPY